MIKTCTRLLVEIHLDKNHKSFFPLIYSLQFDVVRYPSSVIELAQHLDPGPNCIKMLGRNRTYSISSLLFFVANQNITFWDKCLIFDFILILRPYMTKDHISFKIKLCIPLEICLKHLIQWVNQGLHRHDMERFIAERV